MIRNARYLRLAFCLLIPGLVAGTLSQLPALAQERATDTDPLIDVVAGGKGRINYAAGVVKATGYGAPPVRNDNLAQARLMALGAAKADALRNLAMTVGAVQVNADTTVKNYVLDKDIVRTRIAVLLQAPVVVSESFQRDGTAVVVVELPLYGRDSVASAVLPEVLSGSGGPGGRVPDYSAYDGIIPVNSLPTNRNDGFREPANPAVALPPVPRYNPASAPRNGRGDYALAFTPLSDPGPFTSVIIDCRGLDLQAVLSPKLFDTTGREVYGTVRIDTDYAIETGIVGYPRSVEEALRSRRAGAHPLIVKALRPRDRHRIDPVISAEDADRILAANNRDRFLERTRVVFLSDSVR